MLISGAALVSTGIFRIRWQVGGTPYVQKTINAEKVKNAIASLFSTRNQVAFA